MAKDTLIGFGGEGTKKTLQYILIAIVATVVIYVLYKVYQASQTAGSAAGEIAGSAIIAAKTGIIADRQKVCEQVANDCKSATTFVAFTRYPFWVNDADMVNALNRLVDDKEAVLTCEFFRQKAGTSLLAIINNGGVFTSKSYIKPEVLNALI